jgi:hypothetical protein
VPSKVKLTLDSFSAKRTLVGMSGYRFPFGLIIVLSTLLRVDAAPDSHHPAHVQLTIELQDGARLIGKCPDSTLKFQSDVLGKINLRLEDIRNIEVSGKTNSVRLTTSNSDALAVQFAAKEIRLETDYGKIDVPVGLIRRLRVSAGAKICRNNVGLVGHWSGEDNTINSVTGKSDEPKYALTNSLTIEGWIRPRGDGYVIFYRGDRRPGLDPYALSMRADNHCSFSITDQEGHSASVETTVPYYVWTHVAATLDGESGAMKIFTNGILATEIKTEIQRECGECRQTRRPVSAALPFIPAESIRPIPPVGIG